MDSFIHSLFGWSTRINSARQSSAGARSDYDVEKYASSSVDAGRGNAVKKSTKATTDNDATDTARSLLCYTFRGEDINLSKHARKYNKQKKRKFTLFRVSKDADKVKHGKEVAGRTNRDSLKKLRRKPALLLIPPQESLILDWDYQLAERENVKYFNKYIPIDSLEKPVYRLTQLDRHYPLCWFDIQTWYREMRMHLQHEQQGQDSSESVGVRATQSDTAVLDDNVVSNDQDERDSEGIESNVDSPKSLTELLNDGRFGEGINAQYCQVTSCRSPRYVIELYIQPSRRADIHLCHLKTEMIVHCLQKFFYPFADVHVMWVQDLKCHAMRLCSVRGLKQHLPKLNSSEIDIETQGRLMHQMEAMMIVSSDAAVLLKHDELCFIETLSVVADIPLKKLVIFQQTRKSNQVAVIHELVN